MFMPSALLASNRQAPGKTPLPHGCQDTINLPAQLNCALGIRDRLADPGLPSAKGSSVCRVPGRPALASAGAEWTAENNTRTKNRSTS